MDGFPNALDSLRHAVKRHERHRLEPSQQAHLQAEAVRRLEAQQAEAEERWQALQIPQAQQPRPAQARFKKKFFNPPQKPKRVSRVASSRAQNKPPHIKEKI